MQTEQEASLGTYARLILEHQPVATALFDAQKFCLLAANPSYQSLLSPQLRHGQAIGHPLMEVVPAAVATRLAALFRQVVEQGIASNLEEYVPSACDRDLCYWHYSVNPIIEQGAVTAVLLTVIEVTALVMARKQAFQIQDAILAQTHETALRETRQREYIEKILSSIHNPTSLTACAQAILRALNQCFSPQILALYRTSPGQETLSLLASYVQESCQYEASVFPITLTPANGDLLFRVGQQRAPVVSGASQNTANRQKRDGWLALPEIPCLVYMPLWGEHREGILVVGLGTEEEASKLLVSTLSQSAPHLAEALSDARLREALSEEQHRLHSVLDQLPEGIVLVEAGAGKVRYANPVAADLLGYPLPHLIGTPLNQSALRSPYGLSRRDQQSVFRWNFALINALWGKRVTNQEITITRPDGSEIVVLSSAAPIHTPNRLIREAVLVFQDITGLKQLERQKNEFFAVTNHELRTPLTSILGFTELLQTYPTQGTEEMYPYAISSIAQECEYLIRLIDELLDVSRLEYGRLDLKRKYQDVLAPLAQIVSKYIQTTDRYHVHFKLEGLAPGEQLMGWFDLLRVEQIVRNLLSNAVKYSSVGGAIEVGVRPRRDALGKALEVVIWVKDEGMGIAARDLPHIFERFYRASSMDTSSISGFGIGLYLTKQLVQEHEGRIWAESRAGQGSTFSVALPLKE